MDVMQHQRRPAPSPPFQSTTTLSFHQDLNSTRSSSPLGGGEGGGGSTTEGSASSNRSLSPRPLSATLSSNTSEDEINLLPLQNSKDPKQFVSSSPLTPSPVNPGITNFEVYDSPSLSSIASSQKSTASVETATILTRLSTGSTPTILHPFGVIISPIQEEKGGDRHENGDEEEGVGEDSTVSGFDLVDDLPKEASSSRRMNGLPRNISSELLSANRWTGLDGGTGRPSIQQSDSYNSINSSSGWRTDSSSGSPAITSVIDEYGPQTRKLSNAPWDPIELAGPKARKLSKAPWEDDDDADSIMSVSSYAPSMKENSVKSIVVKPKSTLRSRSRSFSALAIRRGHPDPDLATDPATAMNHAEEWTALDESNGLGVGGSDLNVGKLSRSPKGVKDRLTASRGDSILEISHDLPAKSWAPIMIRKGSSSSSKEPAIQHQQASTSSLEPDPSSSMNRTGSRDRGLRPLIVDRSPTPTLLHPSTPPVPHSAPAYTTSFSSQDEPVNLAPRSLSVASSYHRSNSPTFPTSTAGISAPFSAVMGYDGTALTSNNGTGYKLISLEMARQKETERVQAAAAQRKAQYPVENRPETTYGNSNNNTSGSRKSSYTKDEPSNSSPPHPTLKTKRSGFLKRMLGGGDKSTVVPPLPTSTSPKLNSQETFRATNSNTTDYDFAQTNLASPPTPTVITTLASPLPSLHSASTFTSSSSFNPLDSDDFESKTNGGLAPSLSLRPVSMGFLAGLPTDFLSSARTSDLSPLSENDQQETPRVNSNYSSTSPTGVVSPLVLPPSTSFPFLARKNSSDDVNNHNGASSPTSSAATTPLTTPRFSPVGNHSNLHAGLSTTSTTSMYEVRSKTSPHIQPQGLETFSELQHRFMLASVEWKEMENDYLVQINDLRAQVEKFKLENEGRESLSQVPLKDDGCSRCLLSKCICTQIPVGVLSRPRLISKGGEGALFSG